MQPLAEPFRPDVMLAKLVEHGVEFVVVGGLAGVAQGSAYTTYDLDIAYTRAGDNLERLAAALRDLGARLRGAPAGLPFQLDATTLRAGSHFTFSTEYGSLDILLDPAGAPNYDALRAMAVPTEIAGVRVVVASLDHLIAMKEAAGRTKDKLMATEYRVLSDVLRAPRNDDA